MRGPTTPLDALGIVTRARARSLLQAAKSHLADAARAGARPELTIVDDARRGEARVPVELLATLARRFGVDLRCVDRAERVRFADRLARAAGVDREVVRFALLGDEALPSYGAARNTLLLLHAGRAFVSADDDTRAEPFGPRASARAAASIEDGEPTRMSFHRHRSEALARALRREHESLFAWHARFLGARPVDLASSRALHGRDELSRRARRADARVTATLPGLVGDSAFSSALGVLLHWFELVDADARRSSAAWETARDGREVVRVAPRARISFTTPMMAFSFGLDARTLLPPFPPVLRNEDGAFGALLHHVAPGAVSVHLPRALLHAATGRRGYDVSLSGAATRPRFGDLLPLLVDPPWRGGRAARLEQAGARLVELSRAPGTTWAETLHEAAAIWVIARLTRLERWVALAGSRSPAWAADAKACARAMRDAVHRADLGMPSDLPPDPKRTRAIFGAMGTLLQAWPSLWEAARLSPL